MNMKTSGFDVHKANWMKYLLRRLGDSANHSRRTQRSLLLRRMMFNARKPL